MTCTELDHLLDDYVDGLLDEEHFQQAELHLAGCDACRHHERRLRALLACAAALPREIEPARDLWPGIERRLQPRGARRLGWRSPFSGRVDAAQTPAPRWLMPALAAAAALLALATLLPRAGRAPDAPGATAREVTLRGGTAGGLDVAQAEAEYARATAELMEALQARRAALPPATAAGVDENLRTIDKALADIRVALAQDPNNTRLAGLLSSTHRSKVELLQRLVKLSTQL